MEQTSLQVLICELVLKIGQTGQRTYIQCKINWEHICSLRCLFVSRKLERTCQLSPNNIIEKC